MGGPVTATKGNARTGVRCGLGPGNIHLRLAGCDDCNARTAARMTLGRAEDAYNHGYMSQALFEAYMHVWATGAPRFSSLGDGWTAPPTDPEVIALVTMIREALTK